MAVSTAWSELLLIPVWTPLGSIGVRTERLSENVARIADGRYFVVVDSDLAGNDEDAPYVTMVAWAESDGAILRVLDANLEADVEQAVAEVPPPELLPEPGALDYRAILSSLKRKGEPVMESGQYRIATDGIFLHKVLRANRAAYYFRSAEELPDEKPFAITHRIGERTK